MLLPPPAIIEHILCQENGDFVVSSGYNIQRLTFASSLPGITNPNGANTITNKNIEVHNQLIMDVDVTFRNCKFKIFGSEIAILDESKINLDRCELFPAMACGTESI